jgi:hypothetical protein
MSFQADDVIKVSQDGTIFYRLHAQTNKCLLSGVLASFQIFINNKVDLHCCIKKVKD